MRWVLLAVVLSFPAWAQQQYWLLNPGGEHSQVVGTGALLGAGRFRVALQTHLAVDNLLQLREHVTAAWAPID